MILAVVSCHCEGNKASEKELREARSLTERYQEALKSELSQAMGTGGPAAAVRVCNTQAPEIGKRLANGNMNGAWTVRRTAKRARNSQNHPDSEQQHGLSEIQRRLSQGEAPDNIEWQQSRGDSFVYMRPIMMGDMCVMCHGDPARIPSDVKQVLAQLYPNDEAVGFAPGELRGAFVVTGPLAK